MLNFLKNIVALSSHFLFRRHSCCFFTIFAAIKFIWKTLRIFLLSLLFLDIKFSHVSYSLELSDSIVGESTMMLYSTYNLIVSGILLLLISFIAVIEPASWVIVASAISCCAVTFSLCILFIPKVYMQYKKVIIIATELFQNATSKGQDSYRDIKHVDGTAIDYELYNTNKIYVRRRSSSQQLPVSSVNKQKGSSRVVVDSYNS